MLQGLLERERDLTNPRTQLLPERPPAGRSEMLQSVTLRFASLSSMSISLGSEDMGMKLRSSVVRDLTLQRLLGTDVNLFPESWSISSEECCIDEGRVVRQFDERSRFVRLCDHFVSSESSRSLF